MKAILLAAAAFSLMTVSAFGADLEMPIRRRRRLRLSHGPGAMRADRPAAAWGKRISTILPGSFLRSAALLRPT